jgi:hypothetical protein
MARKRTLVVAGSVAASFFGLVAGIVYLSATGIVGPILAKFMLAGLVGLYFGFGVLIAVYRLMRHLD